MNSQYNNNKQNDSDYKSYNNQQTQQNSKKNYLIFALLIAIIAVLLVGVIYQFVCIKNMERQLEEKNTSSIVLVKDNLDECFLNYFNKN